jgi:FkbM family methyltransferase
VTGSAGIALRIAASPHAPARDCLEIGNSEDWGDEIAQLILCLARPGLQMVDVGAGGGVHAMLAAAACGPSGRILAIEADADSVRLLAHNMRENGLDAMMLASARCGAYRSLSSLQQDFPASCAPSTPLRRVDALLGSLDDIADRHAITSCDVLRIADGQCTADVVMGARRLLVRQSPLVAMEIADSVDRATVLEAVTVLRGFGYGLHALTRDPLVLVPIADMPAQDVRSVFACKPERARDLERLGLLADTPAPAPPATRDEIASWLSAPAMLVPLRHLVQRHVQTMGEDDPYFRALASLARAARPGLRPGQIAVARETATADMRSALAVRPSLPRLLTAARLAWCLGRRDWLAACLEGLRPFGDGKRPLVFDEPFLPVLRAYSRWTSPAGIGGWIRAMILEAQMLWLRPDDLAEATGGLTGQEVATLTAMGRPTVDLDRRAHMLRSLHRRDGTMRHQAMLRSRMDQAVVDPLGIGSPGPVPAAAVAQVESFTLCLGRGEMRNAETLAFALVRKAPAFAFSWRALGMMLAQNWRFPSDARIARTAEQAMRKAVSLSPTDAESQAWLGAILLAVGRPREAEPPLRAACALSPGRLDFILRLAICLAQQGNETEAVGTLRVLVQAAERHPGSPGQLAYAGMGFGALGLRGAARATWEAVLACDDKHVTANAGLGRERIVEGDVAGGLACLSRAADDRNHVVAYLDALMAHGNPREALDAWHDRFSDFSKEHSYNAVFWARYPRILHAVDAVDGWFARACEAYAAGYDPCLPDLVPPSSTEGGARSCRPGRRVVLVTYASGPRFLEAQRHLNAGALRHAGISEIVPWTRQHIEQTRFYRQFRALLDLPRGSGYWIWKPFLILQQILALQDGDYVVYHDTGWVPGRFGFDRSLAPLFDWSDAHADGCFPGLPCVALPNRSWTKRDCFIRMDCDSEPFWNAPQISATWSIWRRSARSIEFLCAWLRRATDPFSVTDHPNASGKDNFPEFIDHRHDQSILTNLAIATGFNERVFGWPGGSDRHAALPWMRDMSWDFKNMSSFIGKMNDAGSP